MADEARAPTFEDLRVMIRGEIRSALRDMRAEERAEEDLRRALFPQEPLYRETMAVGDRVPAQYSAVKTEHPYAPSVHACVSAATAAYTGPAIVHVSETGEVVWPPVLVAASAQLCESQRFGHDYNPIKPDGQPRYAVFGPDHGFGVLGEPA